MARSYREIIKTPIEIKLSEVIQQSDSEVPLLCSKCKEHGYCTAIFYKHPTTNKLIPIPNIESNGRGVKLYDQTPITEREISNIVNVRTDIKEATTKFGKKLQQAHDLFHQDEFEQASYIYLDIIETRTDIIEAWRGICASFYFLGKYDEAVAACLNPNTCFESSFVNRFVKGCEAKMGELNNKIAIKFDSSKERFTRVEA